MRHSRVDLVPLLRGSGSEIRPLMAGSDGRSEKEKMLAGELCRAVGPELAADNPRCLGSGLASIDRASTSLRSKRVMVGPSRNFHR